MSLLNPFERRDSRSMGSTASFIVQGQHLVPNNLISAMEALKNSDLYSVTSLISSDIAGADFIGTNQYIGLLNKPNTLSNKVNFWQTVVLNLLLSGNAFIYLEKNPEGIITNMRPIPSSMVTVDLTNDVLSYDIMAYDTFLGGTASADEMIHARIMAYGESPLDALVGHSPLEALGNEVAQQKEATRLTLSTIKNAINPTSVIQVPEGTLSKEAKNTIRTEFEQANTGENSGRVMVLDQSADFKTIAINADVAKYLTQLDWGRNQITKTFGVPDSYLNGQGDQQSSLDQISSLYVGGLNRYIEPLLSELNFKLGGDIRLDMSQIMDYSKATFKKDISDWVKNGVLTPDEAKELLIRKGVI
ncbi:phage portal protein [Weissella paramesenteroides]|uniref:phage portal protein n=1 Tax=Weissella paramesenteroides TaxID=1249 RepID=UPI00123A1B47|nr:phage portal protein [Weissella paramesenteroides]KAA8446942.1 phage portal protein [Weissella paramesenteroides]KAA8450578.1 phage portal protein [Weissella paramesenteroides]